MQTISNRLPFQMNEQRNGVRETKKELARNKTPKKANGKINENWMVERNETTIKPTRRHTHTTNTYYTDTQHTKNTLANFYLVVIAVLHTHSEPSQFYRFYAFILSVCVCAYIDCYPIRHNTFLHSALCTILFSFSLLLSVEVFTFHFVGWLLFLGSCRIH